MIDDKMSNMKKAIIVGAGFSGAVCARVLADSNFEVEIIEKQNHIGGNAFDFYLDDILCHKYGPHIFHTNNEEVYSFLSRFTSWFPYTHKVLANLSEVFVPVPFNLISLHKVFDKSTADEYEKILTDRFGFGNKVSIARLLQEKGKLLEIGHFVLENIFLYYTKKQWGREISELDPDILTRVPINISKDCRYFADKYQYQPKDGYTKMFENILDHPNIKIRLSTNAKDVLKVRENKIFFNNQEIDCPVIYTGAIDEFFDYEFGELAYRTLRFDFETHNQDSYQPAAVVNYTISEDFTRISEFKKFCMVNPPKDKTVIIKEYPLEYDKNSNLLPYYPIVNEKTSAIKAKYDNKIKQLKTFHPLGRLGNYKYINMDVAVQNAINLANEIIKNNK